MVRNRSPVSRPSPLVSPLSMPVNISGGTGQFAGSKKKNTSRSPYRIPSVDRLTGGQPKKPGVEQNPEQPQQTALQPGVVAMDPEALTQMIESTLVKIMEKRDKATPASIVN